MLDWDDLRTFLAVHRGGTLAAAATGLRINATTVGRRLAALEEAMGARLFDRTPEGLVVTRAGRDLVVHAERMEVEALAIEREVAGSDQRLAGVVRVATTETLATRFLAPQLLRFRAVYPDILLELSCSTRSVSLARGEADVVLRLSPPRESDVIAKEIAPVHLALYAARTYLEGRGRPERPDETLAGHDLVLFAATPIFALENAWLEPRVAGGRVVLRSDSVSSIYSAAVFGLGIALLPRAVADDEVGLVRIATESEPEPRRIFAGVHRDLAKSPRVQAVLRFMAEAVV